MITVGDIVVQSFDLDHLDLFWTVEETGEDVQDYDFYVLRSGSPGGPYHTLSGPLVDLYTFRDTQVGLLHQWKDIYYRVRVVKRSTGDSAEYPEDNGARMEARPPLDALEIRRQEYVLFKEHIGKKCWLFKRRHWGTRCPSCFIPHMDRRSRSKCITCYDTGYAGGYHAPIECYIQFDPETHSNQLASLEKQEQVNTTAKALWYPPIDPQDVLVESTNLRWEVFSQSRTERLRAVVHQILQLHRIPPGDIEYALPVNVDLPVQDAGSRSFTNPTNPGELPGGDLSDLEDVFQVYGVDDQC